MFTKIPKRATRITVTKLTNPSGAQGYYDEDGKLISASSTQRKLWAKVMDKASIGSFTGGKQLNYSHLVLNVDAKSAKDLQVGQKLTTDRDDRVFAIVDFYEDEWKFSTIVVAKHVE